MPGLDDLLEAARTASREDRISWRDPIAEHGQLAIPAMCEWVNAADLGAFAVRVLERIAEQPPARQQAINALASVDLGAVAAPVARDIEEALARLGHRKGRDIAGHPKRIAQKLWSGYAAASPLERRFHDDMLAVYRLAGEATRERRPDGSFIRGYWATYFLRAVRNHGGLAYAHQLLLATGATAGFARLTMEERLDLTMEALVLRPAYAELFSEEERQVAASRLAHAGWSAPGVGS